MAGQSTTGCAGRDELISFIKAWGKGPMLTLRRDAPVTYPYPANQTFSGEVSWSVCLTFGHGYFAVAMVSICGQWTETNGFFAQATYEPATVEMAVDLFFSNEMPKPMLVQQSEAQDG